jgi:flagellar motor switch protein FliN
VTVAAPPSKPYDWVKQIPSALFEMDDKPLFGNAPPFPWEAFSAALSKLFNVKNLKVEPSEMQWREAQHLLEGLGAQPVAAHFLFAGMEGVLYWVMSKSEIEQFMCKLLDIKLAPFAAIDQNFGEGFYQFALMQVLQAFRQLDFEKNLSPSLESSRDVPKEAAFCLDTAIHLEKESFHGRLIIPQGLREAWKKRFAQRKLSAPFKLPLADKVQIVVHLEIGKTQLLPAELAQVVPGDYMILDSCSYEQDSEKGRIVMTIGEIPLFRARLKQGNLKILEFPLYHEEQRTMNNKEEDEDFDELTEESDIEDDHEDSEIEHDHEDSEIEGDHEESEIEEDHEKDEAKLPKTDGKKSEAPIPPPKKSAPASPVAEVKIGSGKVNVNELPINVIIEAGRIQMSVHKLMELQPGNMLEVDIHPENGVDLVVNGKRIGKGELLRVGDVLGVRILDIG